MSPQPADKMPLMRADLSKIDINQCHSARLSMDSSEFSGSFADSDHTGESKPSKKAAIEDPNLFIAEINKESQDVRFPKV